MRGGPLFADHPTKSVRDGDAVTPEEGEDDVTSTSIDERLTGLNERLSEFGERFPAERRTYARAAAFYLGFMTAWTYGFANIDRDLATPLVALLLVLPVVVHLGVGFAIGHEKALLLACYPPFLALIGPGLASLLWAPLLMLMIFPGAPLIFVGSYLRRWSSEPQQQWDDWF
jgi:hypothetical protein